MSGALSVEQRELRSVARDFFADRSDEAAVRAQMAAPIDAVAGYDTTTWALLNEQLGVQGMIIPEEYGGSGFGHVDLGVVLEEAGRALYGGPLLSTVLAADAILATGDHAADLLTRIAQDGAAATVAVLERAGSWGAPPRMRAERDGARWRLTGRKVHVLDAMSADLLVVSAPEGLFAVSRDDVTITPAPTLDQTRRQAHIAFDGAPARQLGDGAAVARLLATAAIHLAVEQVGGAARALDMAVEYSRTRHQYGRPIGSFQALKHLCADVATAVESARSAAYAGLHALDVDAPDLALTASAAQVFCAETYTAAAALCVQVHGAIAITWEHPAHLHLKRAKAGELLFGSPSRHRELLAAALGLAEGTS